jgi:hypothetical protein
VIGKEIELAPAANVTDEGTTTALELDVSDTVSPPAGALPVKAKVPCVTSPPITSGDGTSRILTTGTGRIDTDCEITIPPAVDADTNTGTFELTALVEITNVAELDPLAIVTVSGTLALLLFTDSDTTRSLDTTAFRVTVATSESPPITHGDDTSSDSTDGPGVTSTTVDLFEPRPEPAAVSLTFTTAETLAVSIGNVADDEPPTTCTLDGVDSLGSLEVKLTFSPLPGAGPVRYSLPTVDVPPTTEAALDEMFNNATTGLTTNSDTVRTS